VRDSGLSAERERGRERELLVATERGDESACRELVELFLPAIGSVARRFDAGGQVQRSELMQEGVAGLLFAARRFDARRGTPFWAYASFWVRKAMQELVAELTRPAALSDHAVRGLATVSAARRDHLRASGAEPTGAELAVATGFTRAQLDSLLAIDRPPRSFEDATVAETVADADAESAYDRVLDRLAMRNLGDALDERERTVLWSHYGLGRPARTLGTIGSELGLTAERIRQIEKEALEKLRQAAI
jgi:RNA polymerase primary sigma factor